MCNIKRVLAFICVSILVSAFLLKCLTFAAPDIRSVETNTIDPESFVTEDKLRDNPGNNSSGGTIGTLPKPTSFALSFTPADTLFNNDGSEVYMSDHEAKKVYCISTDTYEQKSISFDIGPESMFYKNGKLYVSLCVKRHGDNVNEQWEDDQSGAFAIIDCATFSVIAQYSIEFDPYSIVVSNNDTVYIGSGSRKWMELHSYNQDGTLFEKITSYDPLVNFGYNPQLNRIYGIDSFNTPRTIHAVYLNSYGEILEVYSGENKPPNFGISTKEKNFLITPDGTRILNGSGNVYDCSTIRADDMRLLKPSLDHYWTAIAFNEEGTEFYTALDNKSIYTYDYDTFVRTASIKAQGYPQYLYAKEDILIAVSTVTQGGSEFIIEEVGLPPLRNTDDIEIAINAYGDGGGEGSLSAVVNGNTVTIHGKVADAVNTLFLNIGSDVTVIWDAVLSGTVDGQSDDCCLININGNGTFIVEQNGSIEYDGQSGYAIYAQVPFGLSAVLQVSGGIVNASANAVGAFGEGYSVVIEDGIVEGYNAIRTNGVVSIADGTINATGGTAILAFDESTNLYRNKGVVSLS